MTDTVPAALNSAACSGGHGAVSPPQRARRGGGVMWSEVGVGGLAEATFLPAHWSQEAGSVHPLGVTHIK